MYIPAHFADQDTASLHQLITAHPFGVLVSHTASGLDANHLPCHLDPAQGALGTLHLHVARANPLWRELAMRLMLAGIPARRDVGIARCRPGITAWRMPMAV